MTFQESPIDFYFVASVAGLGSPELYLSGGDRIAIECAKRWADAGHRVTIITTVAGYSMYARYIDPPNKVIFRLVATPKGTKGFAGLVISYVVCLATSLVAVLSLKETGRKSVIYSASDFLPDILPSLLLKRRTKNSMLVGTFYLFAPFPLKPVYTGRRAIRGLSYKVQQLFIFWLLRKFGDMIWVTNELDRARFIDSGVNANHVIAVKGGVDLSSDSTQCRCPEKTFDAVFIGRLHPQKGVRELIDSWARVCQKRKSSRLAMIGVGELENELKQRVKQLGLTNNVTFLGFLDGPEKVGVIRKSRVVVHPAIYDSGGMAAAEAMAFGLPGVCFDLPVLRDYYPTGMLKARCFNIDNFAENILRLLEDHELHLKLSLEATRFAKSWDWNQRAVELLRAIQSSADRKNSL